MALYTVDNFKTKTALKKAVRDGDTVKVYQPGPFGGGDIGDGSHAAEGPHYPQPHTWYATVTIENGKVVSVK